MRDTPRGGQDAGLAREPEPDAVETSDDDVVVDHNLTKYQKAVKMLDWRRKRNRRLSKLLMMTRSSNLKYPDTIFNGVYLSKSFGEMPVIFTRILHVACHTCIFLL